VPVLAWEERIDLLVHAAAQLPDDVRLEIDAGHPERKAVELIASAYGIQNRVRAVPGNRSRLQGVMLRSEPPDSPVRVPPSGRTLGSMAELVESLSRADDRPAASRHVDGVLKGERIAIITNLPTHYRVPLFNALSERCRSAGAELRVLFLAGPPATRPWMKSGGIAFDHVFLRGVDVSRDRGRRVLPFDLESALSAFSPTILITAGFSPAVAERVAFYARRRGLPCGLWSGEIPCGRTARGKLRRQQRRRLVGRIDFAIAYGSESARYLRSLSDDLPLVLGRNTALIPPARTRPKRPEIIEVLTVARAERWKALDAAVNALRRAGDLECRLTVIGDGPQLALLKEQGEGDERIRFLGAVPSDQILRTFSESDVFLFPSRQDPFGLVLVEAMGAGLATIVSRRPGAVADLCVPNVNSLIVDGDDWDQWASALSRLVSDHELRCSIGAAASRTIALRWTIDHAADAMLAGARLGVLAGRGAHRR
jgi:glycosyltransferase involved in cell wall biosynthesis